MRTAAILATCALSLAAAGGHARADASKAWAAAKAGLPDDAKYVIGLDVAALHKTALFTTFYPKLRDKPEAAEMLDALKDGCKLDPASVVQGLVIAMAGDQQDGVAYVALAGVDRTKLSSCLQGVIQARHKDAKVSIKQDGDVTEISKGSDSAFFSWIGKTVIAVALHSTDRAALTRWTGGKGALAKSTLGKLLARANTAAPVWGGGEGTKEIEPGIVLKGGYGAVTYAKGSVAADVHAVMASAGEATRMAASAGKQLDQVKQSGQLPPQIMTLLQTLVISAEQDEVRVKATMAETDLLTLVSSALGGLAGH